MIVLRRASGNVYDSEDSKGSRVAVKVQRFIGKDDAKSKNDAESNKILEKESRLLQKLQGWSCA